jgi:hypothetical protein
MRLAPQLGQNPLRGNVMGFTNAMGAWMRRNGQLNATRCSYCGNTWITYSKNSNQPYNFYVGNSILESKANNACTQADAQGANHLKAKIRTMCDEYGETCNYCD